MEGEAIVETLRQQLELYEQLLETARQKTPVLVGNQVEELNAITLKERKMLLRADELEQQRMTQSNLYFSKMGFRTRNAKLTDMIRTIAHPQVKLELLELQRQLAATLEELRRTNELNQQLVAQSLRFIDYSINLVVEDPNEDVTYRHPMNKAYGNARNGLFDTRA